MAKTNVDIVAAFTRIRDIPYHIPLSVEEPDDCCSGKMTKFLATLNEAGVEARFRLVAFLWSDIDMPESVRAVPHEDESTHVYLEVRIDDVWKIVDPTWDSGLRRVFPVNDWDGASDTTIAVPVRETFSPEKSATIMKTATEPEDILKDLQKNGDFYRAFNDWLESLRRTVSA